VVVLSTAARGVVHPAESVRVRVRDGEVYKYKEHDVAVVFPSEFPSRSLVRSLVLSCLRPCWVVPVAWCEHGMV
jgi:hypothetical protein